MVIDDAMELHYYLTQGASFVSSNIAEEATLIFATSEGFFDER